MKMLLTADLHLTDNPKDEYRWSLFPWLVKQVKKHQVGMIGLLGDLTDVKDRHSEPLVNRVVDNLELLGKACPVIFDPGNHDGIQAGRPFFRFANHIYNVTCLTGPMDLDQMLFLPNTRDAQTDWADINFNSFRYIFCHQTFDGCVVENGMKMLGLPPAIFGKTKARIYSGDIHVPQVVSNKPRIEYVGAPYRIRFGDEYEPRVLMIGETPKGEHQQQDLYFPTAMKFLIELDGADPIRQLEKKLHRLQAEEGDQAKVRVQLKRDELPEWFAIRSDIVSLMAKRGIDLTGPELRSLAAPQPGQDAPGRKVARQGRQSPAKAVAAYGKRLGLSQAQIEAGRGLLSSPK
jgi:hypothetical protein